MKFRSWNDKLNCFIYFDNGEYFIDEDTKNKDDVLNVFNWQNAEQSAIVLEKPCFEGDLFDLEVMIRIVKQLDTFYKEPQRFVSGLKKDEFGFYFYLEEHKLKVYLYDDDFKIIKAKIIGNIHENKELLK